jgi:hypothetical protein
MMHPRKTEEAPPEARRKEIFMALVQAQDRKIGVAHSRQIIAEQFGLSESQVKMIEEEGLDHEWPPL